MPKLTQRVKSLAIDPQGSSDLARKHRAVIRRVRGWPNLEKLVEDGLVLGERVFVAGGTQLDPDFAWLIDIGDDTTISLGVMVLAHDASTRRHTGYTRLGRVRIGKRVFVGAHAVILPGVTIGDDAVVGAGSMVRSDVPAGAIVGGNPAKVISDTKTYVARHAELMEGKPCWPKWGWTTGRGVTAERKREMREQLAHGEGYVE